jgi:hypothetical protein
MKKKSKVKRKPKYPLIHAPLTTRFHRGPLCGRLSPLGVLMSPVDARFPDDVTCKKCKRLIE